MIPRARLRQHPVVASAATRTGAGDTPEAEHGTASTKAAGVRQRPRSVSGLTLQQWTPLQSDVLLRHRARHYARLSKVVDGFRPTYRRRDMLGAFLRMALLRANVAEIEVTDNHISSIALTTDEDTQKTRLVVRTKRGRKAQ